MGVGVRRALLGARPGAPAGADPDVVLVEAADVATGRHSARHSAGVRRAHQLRPTPGEVGQRLGRGARCRRPGRRRRPARGPRRRWPSGGRRRRARARRATVVAGSPGRRAARRRPRPSAVSSVVSAASRSVSWPRMCASPDSRDGRVGQRGERRDDGGQLGHVSPGRRRRRGPPGAGAGTRERQRAVGALDLRAHPGQQVQAARRPAGWWCAGQSGTVTAPPVTSAAARNGAALDRSGSTSTSRPRTGPGATCQTSRDGVSTSTPAAAQDVDGHLEVRQRGHRARPVVHQLDALVEPRPRSAAARRRTATTPEASSRTLPPATAPLPRTENGSRPPGASTVDAERRAARRARSPSAARARAHRRRSARRRAPARPPAARSA